MKVEYVIEAKNDGPDCLELVLVDAGRKTVDALGVGGETVFVSSRLNLRYTPRNEEYERACKFVRGQRLVLTFPEASP